jgi:hypothetical protein
VLTSSEAHYDVLWEHHYSLEVITLPYQCQSQEWYSTWLQCSCHGRRCFCSVDRQLSISTRLGKEEHWVCLPEPEVTSYWVVNDRQGIWDGPGSVDWSGNLNGTLFPILYTATLWSKVVHYIGNREPSGMQPGSARADAYRPQQEWAQHWVSRNETGHKEYLLGEKCF